MEKDVRVPPRQGFYRRLTHWWFTITQRKIRALKSGDMTEEGPVLFAVSHPAGLLPALVLSIGIDRPVRCLLTTSLVRGRLARFWARRLRVIFHEGEKTASEETMRQAIDVLAGDGALVVFADQIAAGQDASRSLASRVAALVGRAEAQHVGRCVAVHPVHLYLPASASESREILIHIDSPVTRAEVRSEAPGQSAGMSAFAAALESRLQENAFQLRPADLEYFLADLEEVLRAGLQEDWASRPDWKQDGEGFELSRWVTEWAKQTNCSNPGRLVALRQSLEDYRRLNKQCALRELEVEGEDSALGSGWRRALLWLETVLGLPVAIYGLLNHAVIGLVVFLLGSFKRAHPRSRTAEWALRGTVTLGLYGLQVFLVAHKWGRAVAGYYAPTLPVSGAYLWRYAGLVRPQARLLLVSLTIPSLKRNIHRLQHALREELDQMLMAFEEKA